MAKKLRPGDPWLAQYEEEIVLRCFNEMERKAREGELKLRPHPVLGPMFARLSNETNVRSIRVHLFTARDLIEAYPGRFKTMARKRQGVRSMRWQDQYEILAHASTHAAIKRLVAKRELRRGWGRSGPKTYSLPLPNDMRRVA